MNRYRFNRHDINTVTDNRHSHIYKCENVGSLTVIYMSAFVGDLTVKMSVKCR